MFPASCSVGGGALCNMKQNFDFLSETAFSLYFQSVYGEESGL